MLKENPPTEELKLQLEDLRARIEALKAVKNEWASVLEQYLKEKSPFKSLAEQAPLGMMLIEADGVITYLNPKFKEVFGYDLKEIPDGRTWLQKAYPDAVSRHRVIAAWLEDLKQFETGEKRPRTFKVTCQDGLEKIIRFIAVQMESGQNLISCEDITEMKNFEESLKWERKQLISIFDGIDHPVYVSHPETHKILYANKALVDQFGQIIGRKCYQALQGLDQPCSFCTNSYIFGDYLGKSYRWEFQNQLNLRWYHCIDKAIQWPDGQLVRLEIAVDITERKQTEDALRISEENYRLLFENIYDVFFSIDPELRITNISPSVERILGYTPDELIGKRFVELNIIASEYVEAALTDTRRVLNGERIISEYEFIAKDGTRKIGELNSVPLFSQDGKAMAVIAIARDITERKQALKEIEMLARFTRENPNPVLRIAQDGTILFANNSSRYVLEHWGKDIGQPLPTSWYKEVKKVLASGQTKSLEAAVGRQTLSFTLAPIVEAGYVNVYGVDITDRKKAEEDLANSLSMLRKATGEIINVIVLTVETRDPYTSGHQKRVADLARAIAQEMDLPSDQVDGLRMAGVIHDLGKVSLPAEILTAPRKLTEIEYALIKTHPEIGYNILKDIDFSWPIAQIVLQHHERMNGSGYPAGLKGEEILLEARILAVADVVEAMATHRPYRPAHGIKVALNEIFKNKDVLYDSKAVEACLRLFKEKGYNLNNKKGGTRFVRF